MNLHRTILLTAFLVLAACTGSDSGPQASTGDPTIEPATLTVLVVEASGGG